MIVIGKKYHENWKDGRIKKGSSKKENVEYAMKIMIEGNAREGITYVVDATVSGTLKRNVQRKVMRNHQSVQCTMRGNVQKNAIRENNVREELIIFVGYV